MLTAIHPSEIPEILLFKIWADFGESADKEYGIHLLKCGIEGVSIGNVPLREVDQNSGLLQKYEQQIKELHKLEASGLSKEIKIEFERRIMESWFSMRNFKNG